MITAERFRELVDAVTAAGYLEEIAWAENVKPQALCERLAAETGFKVPTVDTVLWRTCAIGVINSRDFQPA